MNARRMADIFPFSGRNPRIMGIFAHPDDESLLMGGTFAMAANDGIRSSLITVTHGELGGRFSGVYGARLAGMRAKELKRAARVLGIGTVVHLSAPDQGVAAVFEDTVSRLTACIAKEKPSVVITHDLFDLVSHTDHRETARAAIEAVRRAGPDVRCPVYAAVLKPYADRTGAVLDIEAYRDTKIRALAAHASQGVFRALKFPPSLYYSLNHFEYFIPYEQMGPSNHKRHHSDEKPA